MKISVVIPVYGCPSAIKPICERLRNTLTQITADYEIILVNDACPRGSWEEIEKACEADKNVVGIELARNFGQMKAIAAGLDYSTGDWVVVMDCDLQDKPEEIINLYNKALEGYDAVFARRAVRKDKGLKVLLSKCFYSIYSFASGVEYDPAVCNFSICSRKVIDAYCSMREQHRAYVMYIKWLGFRQTTIDVDHQERFEGKSGYTFKKRMREAVSILTSQSDEILKLTAKVGIFIAVLSFIAIIVLIIDYFTKKIVPGWTSTIAAVFLMGGLTVAAVGIAGIYIGNTFMEVKHRPLYVVRSIKNEKK